MTQRVNLMDPAIRSDPYPLYARLRREQPVCRVDPGGRWVVARHDDVMRVLKEAHSFSSRAIARSAQPEWLGRTNPFAHSMFVMDPPEHGRLRALVSRAFGPGAMARIESQVEAHARRLAAALPLRQSVDFVPDFARQLPAMMLAELLGLDVALHPRFGRWADHIVSIGAVTPGDDVLQAAIRGTVGEMEGYFSEVVERRRRAPGDDLVSDLLRARVDGEALSDVELMGFLFLLLVSGLETTVYLLAHSVRVLIARPDLWAALRAERALLPRFVDEVMRYEPPVHGALRLTTTEVELGGVLLPAGEPVLALVGSACRDESVFADADRFLLDRPHATTLPFGYGAHFCLGTHLTRMEARIGLEALLDRCGAIGPGEGDVRWNASFIVRGPTTLPVVLHE